MNVLLFFIAVLIAGAITGLAYVLSSHWLIATLAGLLGFWMSEGIFERWYGYQRAKPHRAGDNLAAH